MELIQLQYVVDELAVSGGLRGAPIELVKCETVDIEVPATAEIVIEGRIPTIQERPYEIEGPFGEYIGCQGGPTRNPVVEISCITYRDAPIYQAIIGQMAPTEDSLIAMISYEALIKKGLEAIGIRGVVDIHMPHAGTGGLIIISIDKGDYGHPARVANAYFALVQPRGGKWIIVVEDDVDVYNWDDVIRAITYNTSLIPTRRNVTFFEGLNALELDYSAVPDMTGWKTKWDWPSAGILIDATRPYKPYPLNSLPPVKYLERAREAWSKYGLPELEKREIPRILTMEEEYVKRGKLASWPDL